MDSQDISIAARVRFMQMIGSKAYPEMASVVIPPGLIWLYAQTHDASALTVWGVVTVVMALYLYTLRRTLLRELKEMPAQALLDKWVPISQNVALVGGLMTCAPIFVTLGQADFEFMILVYVCICGLTATASTYLTPVFGAFVRFFISAWLLAVAVMVWAFPNHWYFLLPVSLLYSFIIFRHAQATYRFVIDQARLEERSAYLAEQYKLAKEEAEQALKAKTQFLTTASHDLRQPVHAMGMLIEAMQQRNQDTRMAPLLLDLNSCVRSVNLMFNSLLDLSKIEAGIAQQQPVTLSLSDLLHDVTTLFRQEAAARKLQLRLRLPRQSAYVHADPMLLRQAMTNLTQNALRYTREGGVLLSLRPRRGAWHIEVWDTGIGVAAGDQAQIYSPYYRHAQAWSMDSAGHGLGLAVVAQCVRLMGAESGLTSRLGRGSRFWVALPIASSTPSMSAAAFTVSDEYAAAAQTPAQHVSGVLAALDGRCLVLEDDPQINAAWAVLLDTWGVDARFATCASEAFDHLDSGFVPQAVLCDQRLRAGESGFEILQTLLQRCPGAYGVMVSGEYNSPELLRAEDEGYVVLRKPVDITVLHALLARWLAS
jgi:signal transduction histidine kinase/CheY-like chemotaxis protein